MSMYFDIEDLFFDTDDFELMSKIGVGAYSEVCLLKRKSDDKLFAVKIFKTNRWDASDQKQFMGSVVSQRRLNHPSISKILGISLHSMEDKSKLEPMILLDYFPNSTLRVVVENGAKGLNSDKWTWTAKYITLLGISHAMKHMHSLGIIHRDLKPDNVMMDDDFRPKITGFTLSLSFPHEVTNMMEFEPSEIAGTPMYMAPELFNPEHKFTCSIDVYAFAILAYEVVTGRRPYVGSVKIVGLIESVIKGERPVFADEAAQPLKDLIEKCWIEDPDERPSFSEIYEKLSSDPKRYSKSDIDENKVQEFIDFLNES